MHGNTSGHKIGHKRPNNAIALLMDPQLTLLTIDVTVANFIMTENTRVLVKVVEHMKANNRDQELGLLHVDIEPYTPCHCAVWQITEAGFCDDFISALCCSRNRWSCTNEQKHIIRTNPHNMQKRDKPVNMPQNANIGKMPERSRHTTANSQGQYEVYTNTNNIELYWKN